MFKIHFVKLSDNEGTTCFWRDSVAWKIEKTLVQSRLPPDVQTMSWRKNVNFSYMQKNATFAAQNNIV